MSTSEATSHFRPEVRRALPWLIGFRFLINVAMRMTFTFLPALARGTNMTIETMSRVFAARELTSLMATVAGRQSDRRGTGSVMTFAGLLVIGGIAGSALGGVGLVIGMLVFGVGRTAYQVAMQAWVGDEVAYERRGRVTGLAELAWGGSALLGLPLTGLLIDHIGWRAPFVILSIAAVPVLARIRSLQSSISNRQPARSTRLTITPSVVAALTANGALTAAAQFIFLGHGLWLEDTYGLDATQVGFAIVTVGAVEVIATLGSARLTDALGKRRSILSGATLMTLALVALAFFPSPPLALGLGMLVVTFLGFEFAVVSAIPLIAELDPAARARMIAVGMTISTVIRGVITLIATAVYIRYGFATLMTVASVFGAMAVVLTVTMMVEPTPPQQH